MEVLADDHAASSFPVVRQNTTLTARPSHTIEGERHAPVTLLRVSRETSLAHGIAVSCCLMTVATFNELKKQEAHSRMTVARKARRSPQAAAAQRRASLVGNGAKWRITNLNQVARAIAR